MSTPTTPNHHESSTTPPPQTSPRSRSQRLFTEGDEIRLLKSFLKITKSKTNQNSSLPTTTTIDSSILDLIKKTLNSDFTHNQISDKLRRLRVKYHKHARSKSLIKTPHDGRIYEIARKIWGKKKTQAQDETTTPPPPPPPPLQQQEQEQEDNNVEGEELCDDVDVATEEEREEVGLEEFPALVTELSKYLPGNEVWREGLKGFDEGKLREMNEEWRVLQIEEAKVVAKKAQLFHEQVKLILEAVGSSSST